MKIVIGRGKMGGSGPHRGSHIPGMDSELNATSLLPPLSSQGSVTFDCFEAALGAEVRIWSYTQPRYQKELNFIQQLPGKWLQSLRGAQILSSLIFYPFGHSPPVFIPFLVLSTPRQWCELTSTHQFLVPPLPR